MIRLLTERSLTVIMVNVNFHDLQLYTRRFALRALLPLSLISISSIVILLI